MKGEKITVQNTEDIQYRIEQEKNPHIKIKLIFLNFVANHTDSFENICRLCGVPESTAYQWIREWNEKGYLSVIESPNKGGKPPKLKDKDLQELKKNLEEKEYWQTKEVKKLIKNKFNVDHSDDQIVRILREKLKMNFSKPFPMDYRRPEDAETILENQLDLTFSVLKEKGYTEEEIAIGFIDETRPQNTPNTARVWSFGKVRSIKNSSKFKSNTIGFYAIKGESVKEFLVDSKKESIANFLGTLKKANESYKAIVAIIDNFRSHTSTTVKNEAKELGIYLVFLPPYSPDLNPIEYIWKSIRKVLSLVFVKNLDEMKATISDSWNTFSKCISYAEGWIKKFLIGKSYYEKLCG